MMRLPLIPIALAALVSACVVAPPPAPYPVSPIPVSPVPPASADAAPVSDFQTKVSATDPNCHDYTGTGMIDGKPEQLVGHACLQPDGSWKVAEGTVAQPDQYVMVYPPPTYYADGGYYPDYYPGYWGDPWLWGAGLGSSFLFFGPGFHHGFFHHGGGFHRGGGFLHR